MDILPLLDELQTIARNGLFYSTNPYDTERYRRLLELVSTYYGHVLDLPPADVQQRFRSELGYITPKVGSDAAIFDAEGRILLIQRSDDARWCLPCGWVEPNESASVCAVRETHEETGLVVRVLTLVDVFARLPSAYNGPHAMIATVYLCEVVSGELRNSHESLDLRYWSIADVLTWHPQHDQYAQAAYATWLARRSEESTP